VLKSIRVFHNNFYFLKYTGETKRKTEHLFLIKLIPKRKRVKKRTITTYQIDYQIKKEKLESLKLSDGIYCILSNLPEEKDSSLLVFLL